jgi:hypothetical protein
LKHTAVLSGLVFVTVYSLFSGAAIFFLVRGLGAIVGLVFDVRGVIAAALSQLANARISVPVWIPLCGALSVCVFRAVPIKRLHNTVALTVVSAAILLFAFTAAFLLTKVNGVFVHVAIGIIRMLLKSGSF